jgi:hypothetical protein
VVATGTTLEEDIVVIALIVILGEGEAGAEAVTAALQGSGAEAEARQANAAQSVLVNRRSQRALATARHRQPLWHPQAHRGRYA